MITYNKEIKWRLNGCEFRAYHDGGETGCAYISLDYEEHPDLEEEDLEPLGKILIKVVDDYLKKRQGEYTLEEHSSSVHVKKDKNTIAKIWHNQMHNSQIKDKYGALLVAKEFVKIMEGDKRIEKMPRIVEECGTLPAGIVKGHTTIASFKEISDANRYINEYATYKYKQEIDVSGCGIAKLMNDRRSGTTIELFKGMGNFVGDKKPENILYHLREFIHDKVEEA